VVRFLDGGQNKVTYSKRAKNSPIRIIDSLAKNNYSKQAIVMMRLVYLADIELFIKSRMNFYI